MVDHRRLLLVLLLWFGCIASAPPQEPSAAPPGQGKPEEQTSATTKNNDKPLPDIPALMIAVEANQRASEGIEKNYMFRSVVTQQETDGHDKVKKTETTEYEIFWSNGVPVQRLVRKNGKELSADELKKENERVDQEAAKANTRRARAEEQGKETDPRGREVLTASRALELGSFRNARRLQWNGRDTIAVDFTGDPKAKTRTRFEAVVRDLAGTLWIDEQDRVLVKVEGHFVNDFKIGGGILADIKEGTSFGLEQRKINGEVWLPAMWEGQGAARALLLFNVHGNARGVDSDYRKFKATSTILPATSTEETEPAPKGGVE